MRTLGVNGQWGNQLFEYAFIRTATRREGMDYAVPPWAGQKLFGLRDPVWTDQDAILPQVQEKYERCDLGGIFGEPIPPEPGSLRNRDYWGYCQFHTSWYAPDREFLESLFVLRDEAMKARVEPMMANLRQRGKTYIGLHLRLSDAGRLFFPLIPVSWALRWLHKNWNRFDQPVLVICSEDPVCKEQFAGYNVVTAEDLGVKITGETPEAYTHPYTGWEGVAPQHFDFFPDWYLLSRCQIVMLANSSFSFTAALFGGTCRELWRMELRAQDFVGWNPWNCRVLCREPVDEYPGTPGIRLDANPRFDRYWRGYKNKCPAVPEDPKEIERWSIPPK